MGLDGGFFVACWPPQRSCWRCLHGRHHHGPGGQVVDTTIRCSDIDRPGCSGIAPAVDYLCSIPDMLPRVADAGRPTRSTPRWPLGLAVVLSGMTVIASLTGTHSDVTRRVIDGHRGSRSRLRC